MDSKKIDSGLVVMFDGPDGVGKTTQLKLAKEALEAEGYSVYQTRVNGGTPIGEKLREALLSDAERPAETDILVLIAMYYALAKDLEAHRAFGAICLVDRSPLSFIGYQVYGSGLNEKRGIAACEEVMPLVHPELIICYQAPFRVLCERRDQRLKTHAGHQTDYFEKKSDEFVRAVMEGFAFAAQRYNVTIIDAEDDIKTIHTATIQEIDKLLGVNAS